MDENITQQIQEQSVFIVTEKELSDIKAIDTLMKSPEYMQRTHMDGEVEEEQQMYFVQGRFGSSYARPVNRPYTDSNLSEKKLKEKKAEIKSERKNANGLPISKERRRQIYEIINNKEVGTSWLNEKKDGITNSQILNEIKDGTYKHFEKLDGLFRDTLASNYLEGYMEREHLNSNTTTADCDLEQLALRCENDYFNPVFRLGLSQMARFQEQEGVQNGIYRALDNEIARRIMVRTLTNRIEDTPEVVEEYKEKFIRKPNLSPEQVDAEFEKLRKRERATQAQMAKQLMLMHLGNLLIVKDGIGRPPTVPMASVIAHCSRTFINTPCYDKVQDRYASKKEFIAAEKEMWDSILGQRAQRGDAVTYENNANIKWRLSSTHSFKRRRINRIFGKEVKLKMNLVGQTGMNVAIGGMGCSGVGDEMINLDGTCGHVYGMHKESGDGIAGGYLFGYESDSYAHTNQLGHTHDLLATGEKASSFGCQRIDEIGNKLGGRQADVTHLDPRQIVLWMNTIDKAVETLSTEKLRNFMNLITGNLIIKQNSDGLISCLDEITTAEEREQLKDAFGGI